MPISKEQPSEPVESFGSGIPPQALAQRLHPRQILKIPTARKCREMRTMLDDLVSRLALAGHGDRAIGFRSLACAPCNSLSGQSQPRVW